MLALLLVALEPFGVEVVDLRGKLPINDKKTFAKREPAVLKGLAAHHSAGPPGDHERFEQIARYHAGPNHISPTGCPGICYTMGIDSTGKLGVFWDLDVAPWSQGDPTQVGDENREWLSCLLVGNFASKDNAAGGEPTIEQMTTFSALALACRKVWGPTFRFSGHFAFGKPACPGSTMETVVRAFDKTSAPVAPPVSIRDVQAALAALGYLKPEQVDGKNGPTTRGAICAFQVAAGLKVDGKADPKTIAALKAAQVRS